MSSIPLGEFWMLNSVEDLSVLASRKKMASDDWSIQSVPPSIHPTVSFSANTERLEVHDGQVRK